MGDKEIKSWLKEAREQIKNKEFKAALRDVKKVLNKDKSNYMALVFCGLCLSEMDQPDQAVQAYKRAVDSNPDQVVGWEGLLKFYEKHKEKSEYQNHHLEVLEKLTILHISDVEKFCDVTGKLAQLQLDKQDLNGALATLQSQSGALSDQPIRLKETQETIIKVLASQSGLSDVQNELFKNLLQLVVTDAQTPNNMENLKHLIKLLYKNKDIDQLIETALKMTNIFSENIYPLEWLCKVFLEFTAGVLETAKKDFLCENISSFISKLIVLSSNSSLASLAQGALSFQSGNYVECSERLKRANETSTSSPNVYGLFLLAQAQFESKDYFGVEQTWSDIERHILKIRDESVRSKCRSKLVLITVQSLYYQMNQEKIKMAMELIKYSRNNTEFDYTTEFQVVAAKVFSWVGDEQEVTTLLSTLEDNITKIESNLIRAILLKSLGKYEEAKSLFVQCIEDSPDNFEACISLGQLLWEQEDRAESLPHFLKAARVNPHSWVPFLYLGQFYQSQDSSDMARKCLYRCLQLNPSSTEAGMLLSDILRISGRFDDNLTLLTKVTSETANKAGWAWLRLGVHYLATDEPAQAVATLQSALRSDSSSVICWEALAEAYMARGSFTAARKAFEKVVNLGPKSCQYSLLMIAGIRHKLGKYHEAIADYQCLLETYPDYLPALRGLGETHLALGSQYLEQHIDKNVVECAQAAIEVLTRAAVVRPNLPGTWYLIGEVGCLLGPLPHCDTNLLVPAKLITSEPSTELPKLESVDRVGVLEIAVRCYTKALFMEGEDVNNAGRWQDLAYVYNELGKYDQSIMALKHGISLSPNIAGLWTCLGLVYAKQENWALAQHCLIQSLKLDSGNAVSWTNLGAIYLKLGEQELANKAFNEAQNSEPDYIKGWAGQATVAEVAGFKSESMDLFRHCTFLGPESESARGYGDWVCGTIARMESGQEVEHHNRYIVENMWGVAVAVDSMTAYTTRNPEDGVAQCQLGLLQEHQGLINSALSSMLTARNLILKEEGDETLADSTSANLGRLLIKADRSEEAVQVFSSLSNATLHSQIGLALAHYKLGQFQEAYQAYESCLHWLADNDGLKSHILVAMGSLAYRVEGMSAAKTLLFQSCQLSPPSVRGLFSLCVIGVQHTDMNLIDAALSEMVPHEQDPRFAPDIAFLRASILVLKGDVAEAKRGLLSNIHKQPWLAKHWSTLSLFLLQNSPKDAKTAAKFALKSSVMKKSLGVEGQKEDGVNGVVLGALSLLMAGDGEASLREAKAACHMHPHLMESWAVLVAAARISGTSAGWMKGVLSHLTRGDKKGLVDWAVRVAESL